MKLKEHAMEYANLPDIDPQEELYYETVSIMRKVMESGILTNDEFSTLLYATAVNRDHVVEQEDLFV
jgi:hypothetical protein